MLKYRKILVISPGLLQLRKGSWVGLETEGFICGGGGGVLNNRNKKLFEMSNSSVD